MSSLSTPTEVPPRLTPNPASGLVPRLPRHIPSLDGLRAVSIALVFLAHVGGTRHAPALLGRFHNIGNLGVKVFFVISGFLITTLLLREWERSGRISLKGFYLRRALRIFPAFYAYVGISWLLAMVGLVELNRGDLLHAVTYTMNYHHDRAWTLNHLWSLAVEEQFYLIWPALLCVLGPRRALAASAMVLVAAPTIRAVMWGPLGANSTAMTREFQAVADSLATGCLLSGCYNRLGACRWYLGVLGSRFFLLVPCALLVVAIATYKLAGGGGFYIAGQSVANLAIALGIDRCVRFPDSLEGRLLNTRPLVFVGVLSYSLYLWQELFLNPFDETSMFTAVPINLVLAVLAALASYYLIERPFLRLKSRVPGDVRITEAGPVAPPFSGDPSLISRHRALSSLD